MSITSPSNTALFAFLIVAAYVVIFALFWIFMVWLLGRLSGWQKLAERYPAAQPAQGKMQRGKTLLVGSSRYRNGMTVVTNSVGIHLSPIWLFRFGHPPLFIPWGELSNPRPTTHRWQPFVKLDVGMPPLKTIALSPAVLEGEPAAAVLLQTAAAQERL